jgi:hypothetical protein
VRPNWAAGEKAAAEATRAETRTSFMVDGSGRRRGSLVLCEHRAGLRRKQTASDEFCADAMAGRLTLTLMSKIQLRFWELGFFLTQYEDGTD